MRSRPCDLCSAPVWYGKGSASSPRCRACRAVEPKPRERTWGRRKACEVCGLVIDRRADRFCSYACRGIAGRVRATDDHRVTRRAREVAAPGLSDWQRRQLLAAWRRQGRGCAYCSGPAQTVDHVVPLVRGGSNFEGNLVPACRRCNGSKSARFVSEWRRDRAA